MASPMVDRRFGLVGNAALKAPVTVVATGNITLSGEQTIDGHAVVALNASSVPDRVLCIAQTDGTQNGIYDVSTGTWNRSPDSDSIYDFAKGSTVFVTDGTTNHGTYWQITSDGPITPGTTNMTWTSVIVQVSAAVATATAAAATATTEAGVATTQAGLATTQVGLAAAQVALATTQASAAAGSVVTATAEANIAIAAAATAGAYPNSAASNVPRGLTQASVGAITAGSGGTNGTFALAWSSGNFSINPTGTFTVVGGALTAVAITGPGLYIGSSPTVPTPSFTASSGLTGAAVALTAQFLVASGQGYWVTSSDGNSLDHYKNVSGTATADASVGSISTTAWLAIVQAANRSEVKDAGGPVNIFDKSAATVSFALPDGSGAPISAGGYFYTGYMPVVPGDFLTFNLTGVSGYGVHFYDANKTYISSPGFPTAGTPVAVPSNAYFARCTFQAVSVNGRSTQTKHDLVVVQGQTVPSYYMPYGRPAAVTLWTEAMLASYDWPLRNLHNSATTFVDYTFDANGAPTPSVGSFVTDLIPVIPGATYTVYANGAGTLSGGTYFFDLDKIVTYSQDGAFMTGLTQITVPTSCFWMRLGYFTSSQRVANLQVYHGTSSPGALAAIKPAMLSDISGQWGSKNWFVQGDSITDGTGWFEAVAAFHNATVTLNAALGGRSMNNALKKHDGTALASTDFTSIDLAVILMGINDFQSGTTIGTISDSTATASFYGQTKNYVETLLGWKPTMRMVICTPMQKIGGDPINYVTALKNVAALYSIPVLDFYLISGLNQLNTGTWTADGLHPNAAGYKALLTNPGIGFFKTCLPVS